MNGGASPHATATTSKWSVYLASTAGKPRRSHVRRRSCNAARPWYRRPIITRIVFIDVDMQRAALYVGIFSMLLAVLTFAAAAFDLYCYAMTAPGSTHYGFFALSYEFVYVGNAHVRNLLIAFAAASLLLSAGVVGAGALQVEGVRSERERLLLPWLGVFAVFALLRLLALAFFVVVNDLVFAYNLLTALFWAACLPAAGYGWLVVYSLHLQLADLSRLEDAAHLHNAASIYERLRHPPASAYVQRATPESFDTPTKPRTSVRGDREDLSTTVTTPVEMAAAGPSRSVSVLTDADLSIASSTATMPIEQVVYERYLGHI